MDETSESYPVKIRTIDSSQFVIHVTKDTLISELKYLIKTQIQLPEEQQRIIYKGKVLKNPDSLGSYKIERGHVLQLTAGCLQLEPVHQEQEEPRVDAINDILRLAIEISPESFLTRRRQRYHRPRDIDSNERLETIRQNLQTIESMLQSMNSGISDGEILGFDNSRRRLVRGQ